MQLTIDNLAENFASGERGSLEWWGQNLKLIIIIIIIIITDL